MASVEPGNGSESTIVKRIGFWLGLLLFVVILVLPTPEGMRRVVCDRFSEEINAEARNAVAADPVAEKASRQEGDRPDERTILQAKNHAVERRARVMLAAAAVTALVGCWWITVALPIPVTSLLPLVLFPLVGVMSVQQAATPYANSNVFLFMGGFMIALAIERWGLHRRMALHIVRIVGTSPATIIFGFMLASAGLSMWISNTATTLMMLPIGLAVIAAASDYGGEGFAPQKKNFAAGLMLGIAYAASIGGIATPIGTPPNIAFRGQFAKLFPGAPEISFGQWMIVFLPLVAVFLPIAWLVLVRVTCRVGGQRLALGRSVVAAELSKLGAMSRAEKRVLMVFAATVLLWMTRSLPVAGENFGWALWLQRLTSESAGLIAFRADYINDAVVAVGMAALLFIIPAPRLSDARGRRRTFLMDWKTAERLPWGILLLFGGGFSIAAAFSSSGLSVWCGHVFTSLGLRDPLVTVAGTCTLMTFLTEMTSNTATTGVMLPVLAGAAQSIDVNPLLLMLPATVSASCAFMMPVATPPNAIVFGSGYVEMGRMVKTGLILNLVGIVLVTGTFYFIACPVLGIDPAATPAWAQ